MNDLQNKTEEYPGIDQGVGASPRTRLFVYGLTAIISAAMMVYALTISFVWDEGFHVLAAQLIDRGKTPYLDFCFPQTLLNAYWNAAWMRVFGENWRIPHIPAALELAAAMFLTAQFLLNRFPVVRWRAAAAVVAVSFIGLHTVIVQFGPIGQAYAAGMLLTVAAFRVAAAWPDRARSATQALGAGLLAGAAAGCTLLTAPVAPILLVWFWLRSHGAQRFKNTAGFVLGAVIPFTPMIWLFAKSPRVVFFNIVQYQALFRRVNWSGATVHDVDVLSSWLMDSQTLFLGLLAVFGFYYLLRRSTWPGVIRRQFYLALWVAIALIVYIATAHPTFGRYFVFAIPFLSVLAATGLYGIAVRLCDSDSPLWPTSLLILLVVLGYARFLFDQRDSTTWMDYEKIAQKVKEVTPKNGLIFADEQVYFVLKRIPPPGMEFSYSHELELPPAQERLYHIISYKEIASEIKSGKFSTAESCSDDHIDKMHLYDSFANNQDIKDCTVFWNWKTTKGH